MKRSEIRALGAILYSAKNNGFKNAFTPDQES